MAKMSFTDPRGGLKLLLFSTRLEHMPFMGFLSILLLIAIAADDVFVFYDTFERIKVEYADEGLEVWQV